MIATESTVRTADCSESPEKAKYNTDVDNIGLLPILSWITYHLKTVWLFTVSEHRTIVYPWTAFGFFGAVSGPELTTNRNPRFASISLRLPQALFWMWLNILAFTVANQRLPSSVAEDIINKPWRPIPSGRITIVQARRLLLVLIPCIVSMALAEDVTSVTLLALLLSWMYNDLGGSDEDFILRNAINASGLVCGSAATTLISCGASDCTFNHAGLAWLAIEWLIVFTTLQIQDLRDQQGDRLRGRSTAPIVLGDTWARWSIAAPILFWSLMCPVLWNVDTLGFVVPAIVGTTVACRVLLLRTVEEDRRSWSLWGLWIGCVFALPAYKALLVPLQ